MDKVYLVVRADLSPGQQAVQAAHALQEFNMHFPEEAARWHRTSNTLAILGVSDEKTLEELFMKAVRRGFSSAPFHEPDRGGEMTAVAFGPDAKSLCRNLNLLFPI